jgi:hypothetical protein
MIMDRNSCEQTAATLLKVHGSVRKPLLLSKQ